MSVVLVAQSCLILWHPMNRGAWWATVHGILQARILEWVAMPYPGIEPGSPALQADSLPFEPQGSPGEGKGGVSHRDAPGFSSQSSCWSPDNVGIWSAWTLAG